MKMHSLKKLYFFNHTCTNISARDSATMLVQLFINIYIPAFYSTKKNKRRSITDRLLLL